MVLVLSMTAVGVIPSVYAPSNIGGDDPDGNDSSTTALIHRLNAVTHSLEKVTARLDAINNGFTDPHTIKLLSHIDNHLGKIDIKLQKLAMNNQGPPQDPAIIAELQNIIGKAHSIASIAQGILGSNQIPPDPLLISKLNEIIAHANSIASIAQGILS